MLWPITVHRIADRHERLHERDFAVTREAAVPVTTLGDAVAAALSETGFADVGEGSFVITVDWPFTAEAGGA